MIINTQALVATCEEIAILSEAGEEYAPAVERLKRILSASSTQGVTYAQLVDENATLRRALYNTASFEAHPSIFDHIGLVLLGFISGACVIGLFGGLVVRGWL